MKIVITQAERLDEIVFEHYGTLEFFDEVLASNQHILHKTILEVGDEITLD